MAKHRGTLTVGDSVPRKTVLQVDTGADAELVKAVRCTGVGPFTVTVRPVTWLDRLGWRLTAYLKRPWRKFRDWRTSRCDARFCWRRYSVVDVEWDDWCEQHSFGKIVQDDD